MVTAVAADPMVSTTIAPRELIVHEWSGAAVTSLCVTGEEEYSWWILIDEAQAATLPDEVEQRPGPPTLVEVRASVTPDPFTPIADRVATAFGNEGITLLDDGCDATLTVMAVGEPLSDTYDVVGRQFTGATVRGELALAAAGRETLILPVSGVKETTSHVQGGAGSTYLADEPTEAPYFEAVADSICSAFTEWFAGPLDLGPNTWCRLP